MAPELIATNAAAFLPAFAKASPAASQSSLTALDHWKGRPLRDAFCNGRWIVPGQPHPAIPMHVSSLLAGNLPECAFIGSTRPFISSRLRGSSPNAAHLASKSGSQTRAYWDHLSPRPFQRCIATRLNPSEATNGRVPEHSRAFHKNEGELPNVGS